MFEGGAWWEECQRIYTNDKCTKFVFEPTLLWIKSKNFKIRSLRNENQRQIGFWYKKKESIILERRNKEKKIIFVDLLMAHIGYNISLNENTLFLLPVHIMMFCIFFMENLCKSKFGKFSFDGGGARKPFIFFIIKAREAKKLNIFICQMGTLFVWWMLSRGYLIFSLKQKVILLYVFLRGFYGLERELYTLVHSTMFVY